jgi:putative ubiquitin-RnfH superfamily antitoxin RatB of RatAB toxin-antitoxin module
VSVNEASGAPPAGARAGETIGIEVVFALPDRQCLQALAVPRGTTAAGAVRLSTLPAQFPDHDLGAAPLGVFGHRVDPGFELAPGDRVEIYRPLSADPKTVRRQLAASGRTMGRRRPLPR